MSAPAAPGSQRRLLVSLAEAGVDFVLVGGHAVAAHGYERATRDVDVVYSTAADSCERMAALLAELGAVVEFADTPAPGEGIEASWLAEGGHFRISTDAGPLDALSAVAGLDHAALARRAVTVELSGATIPICSYEDLVAMKRNGGRPRDEEDLRELEEVRRREE